MYSSNGSSSASSSYSPSIASSIRSSPSSSPPLTPATTIEEDHWVVQKFGGTSLGKFAKQIVRDIIL